MVRFLVSEVPPPLRLLMQDTLSRPLLDAEIRSQNNDDTLLFFFMTLDAGPRRSLRLEISDTNVFANVFAPCIRQQRLLVLREREVGLQGNRQGIGVWGWLTVPPLTCVFSGTGIPRSYETPPPLRAAIGPSA